MADFELSNKAVQDLDAIWNYTFINWSEAQADRYYRNLMVKCQDLANNPGLGKKYNEIHPDLYGLKSNRHIIFYRVFTKKPIEITRILHECMDLKKRINE